VIAAAGLYFDEVWPSIVEGEKKLGPKPEISQQGSCEEVDAWTAAKDFLTRAEKFADHFGEIYQTE